MGKFSWTNVQETIYFVQGAGGSASALGATQGSSCSGCDGAVFESPTLGLGSLGYDCM